MNKIIYIIIFLLAIIIFIFVNSKFKTPLKNKYITFTLSNNSVDNKNTFSTTKKVSTYNGKDLCIAGMRHVQQCLKHIIYIANKTNRCAVLPPPWLFLASYHNNNIEIDKNISWNRYFDFSDEENIGFISKKDSEIIHLYNPRGKVISKSNLNIKNIKPNSDIDPEIDVVVVTYFDDADNNIKIYDCHANDNLKFFNYKFKPSELVKNISKRVRNKFNNNFNTIHIRSGDLKKENLKYISKEYILDFFNKHNISKTKPIILFTNEKNISEYQNLKEQYNIIFDIDIEELMHIRDTLQDNFLLYEVSNDICRYAKINICTSSQKLGKCNLFLKTIT